MAVAVCGRLCLTEYILRGSSAALEIQVRIRMSFLAV